MEISLRPKSANRNIGDFVIGFGSFDCGCFHKLFGGLLSSSALSATPT
jgi:hypothetical protein